MTLKHVTNVHKNFSVYMLTFIRTCSCMPFFDINLGIITMRHAYIFIQGVFVFIFTSGDLNFASSHSFVKMRMLVTLRVRDILWQG